MCSSDLGYTWSQTCTYFNALGGDVIVPPGPLGPTLPQPQPAGPTTPAPIGPTTPVGPVTITVPFGVYNLTITGTPIGPTPYIPIPDPVTINLNGQVIRIVAALSS